MVHASHVIGTALCVDFDLDGRKVLYPQISHLSSVAREAVYWKCAIVCLASLRKHHAHSRICLVTNSPSLPIVDGVSIQQMLERYRIEYRYRCFADFCPPYELSKTFRNAFYKFEALAELGGLEDQAMLLDTDCVASRSIQAVFDKIKTGELGVYEVLSSNAGVEVQGISCQELADFFQHVYGRAGKVDWLGGEFYCGGRTVIQELTEKLRFTLTEIINSKSLAAYRFRNAVPVLSNDEFLASISVAACSFPVVRCNDLVCRLWTAHDSSRSLDDRRFLCWHLPAEKHLGFKQLFPAVCNEQSLFWKLEGENFVAQLGGVFAIPVREWNPGEDVNAKTSLRLLKWLLRKSLPRPFWAGLRSWFMRGVWDTR